MTQINIGNKIRELRKKKGITQEALADTLSVSPQAVSKWEMGLTYPDMSMIPVLAGFFEVSLDILFDYNVREIKAKIQKIIDDAWKYFFDDTVKYIEIMKSALREYPGSEELQAELLNAYEYALRDQNDLTHLDETIELSQKIITESSDFIRVCNAKDIQAAAYLKKDEYAKAKEVLESLPLDYNIRYGAMAFRLSGRDKQEGAIWSRCHHLQGLYQACMEEGNSWFFMDRHPEVTFRDYTPADQYLWDGMQTFHWSFHQCIAACHKRLGNIAECEQEIAEAYRLISVVWKDFEENREQYMEYFNRYLREYDLGEYVR